MFRFILPNPFLSVCSGTDPAESFLSLLLFQIKHLLFFFFSHPRKYLSLSYSQRRLSESFPLKNDDQKGEFQNGFASSSIQRWISCIFENYRNDITNKIVSKGMIKLVRNLVFNGWQNFVQISSTGTVANFGVSACDFHLELINAEGIKHLSKAVNAVSAIGAVAMLTHIWPAWTLAQHSWVCHCWFLYVCIYIRKYLQQEIPANPSSALKCSLCPL